MLAFDYFARPAYTSSSVVAKRSPLGLRDSNSCSATSTAPSSLFARKSIFSTYMSSGCEDSQHINHSQSQASQQHRRVLEPRRRESKFAPLLRRRGGEEERQSRRNAYLASSRRAGDDRIYQTRMEQSWRREALDEQSEWQARMEAQHEEQPPIDEDEELRMLNEQQMLDGVEMDSSQMMELPSDDDDMHSYFLWSQEPSDRDQLPAYHAEQQMQEDSNMAMTDLWSDDDELERCLLQAARQAEELQTGAAVQSTTDQADSEMT